METIQSKKLTVELIKVKAHDGDFFNKRADILAKEALSLPAIEINCQETGPILAPPTWNGIPIDIPIRNFIKELNKKAFWIKIAQNELPTLDNLATRKSKLYKDHQTCPLCMLENETRIHL